MEHSVQVERRCALWNMCWTICFSFLAILCILRMTVRFFKSCCNLLFCNFVSDSDHNILILVVRFKHSLGCGFLYGPMLFLAVVNHIPLDDYSEYSTLSTVVSIITSVALLNLEQFGRIPWCFFESIPKLYNYCLRVLGPLTVLLVLLGITALVRWHPKCSLFEKIRNVKYYLKYFTTCCIISSHVLQSWLLHHWKQCAF